MTSVAWIALDRIGFNWIGLTKIKWGKIINKTSQES